MKRFQMAFYCLVNSKFFWFFYTLFLFLIFIFRTGIREACYIGVATKDFCSVYSVSYYEGFYRVPFGPFFLILFIACFFLVISIAIFYKVERLNKGHFEKRSLAVLLFITILSLSANEYLLASYIAIEKFTFGNAVIDCCESKVESKLGINPLVNRSIFCMQKKASSPKKECKYPLND